MARKPAQEGHLNGSPNDSTPNFVLADVASLAYALWLDRGRPIGSPEIDWFRAEEMLRKKGAANSVRPLATASGT